MLTAERLREILHYESETGLFKWKITRARAKLGEVAAPVKDHGYIRIGIDGKRYYAHRLAWLYVTGKWPSKEIDHRNLDKSDNRWSNLRLATHAQNCKNEKVRRNNSVGLKGVSFYYDGPFSYRARIFSDGKEHHLGIFRTKEEAHAAYRKASEEIHGKFGRAA